MITDRDSPAPQRFVSVGHDDRSRFTGPFLFALAGALAVWLGGMAAVTAIAAPSGDYIVVAPRARAFAALVAADAALMGETAAGVVVRGEGPETVRRLYGAGAWLVLPAGRRGCLALSGKLPAAS